MSHKHYLHSTDRQTDEERALSGIEVFASGEGMFFDDANQSVNTRYQRGLNGGLNSANSYDDTGAASMDADASGMYFTEGNRQPDRDSFADTFANSGSVVAPNNLLFDGVIIKNEDGDNVNYLSNSQNYSVATFNQINSYIHYTPNPLGGVGEIDQTAFYYNYNPLAGTPVSQKFYRYGQPS